MTTSASEVDPIDAVVTWVDGNDPSHVLKRQTAMRQRNIQNSMPIAAGRDSTRFLDNGEIRYCLLFLRKFAPWLRHIYLITDDQVPGFLNEEMRNSLGVRVIDHKVIFQGHEWALPTFNSITIETALWRIPGLSGRFLYLNDDFFVIQPVTPEDFFCQERVVLRGRWKPIQHFGPTRIQLSMALNFLAKKFFNINRAMSLLQQMKAAELAGARRRYYKAPHVPHPLRTQTLKGFFHERPDLFTNNIRFPFRDTSQFVATFLANHLEIARGRCELLSDNEAIMICFNRDSRKTVKKKLDSLKSKKFRFLCVQSLEEASEHEKKTLIKLLDDML